MSQRRLDNLIDRGTIEGFGKQLLACVEQSTAISLHTGDGEQLWSTSDIGEACLRDLVRKVEPGRPCRAEVGGGRFVYLFPVKSSERDWLVLGILVVRIEPASLEKVFKDVSAVLACLERQFAVTATLATTTRLSAELSEQLKLMVAVNELEPLESLSASLQALLELCRDGFCCDAAVAWLPDDDTRILVAGPSIDEKRLDAFLPAVLERVRSTGRINLSSQSLCFDGKSKKAALTAPIVGSAGQIYGLFTAVSERFAEDDARIARTISSKIDLLFQQFSRGRPKFLLRDEFLETVDNSLRSQSGSPHTVLYVDVDKTHLINDSFGYATGDAAIETVSELLIENTGKDQVITHLLGDRFAVLLRQTDSDVALSRAEHVLELLNKKSIERKGKSLQLSASIGIATAPFVAESAADLLTIAEVASRSAKERGGNQAAVFQTVDASIIQRRSDADQVGYLQMALLENKFVLYAQQIRRLDKKTTASRFEILLRLRGDGTELIPPERFLSAADRYQMMPALDRWVVINTLAALAEASASLEVSLSTFAINVSAQSLAEAEFIDHIEQAIVDSGVPPDMLCFELTETAMVRQFDKAQRFVHRLQKRGCRVALDDFGTGYSSFAYLKHLPVQYLKIDGAFVRDLLENRLSEAIVSAVVEIAGVMGAATVGEHVENELIQQKLIGLGVDYAQGFHIHRPQILGDVLTALEASGVGDLLSPSELTEPVELEILEN